MKRMHVRYISHMLLAELSDKSRLVGIQQDEFLLQGEPQDQMFVHVH